MNRKFRVVALLAIMFAFVLAPNSSYGQKNESTVLQTLTDYDRAWNSKNVAAVTNVLAEDYVYFSSTGTLTRKKATLDFLVSPDYKLDFVNRTEIQLVSQSATVAVVSSRWIGRGMYGKEPINDDQRCGLVFTRERKSWKLLSEHCVQIEKK